MSASPKLRLFGGFSLSDASGEVAGLTLRKTEALIAFLAAGPSHSQPREVLANLLWSESTQAGALHSLRQARLTLTRNLPAHGLAFVQFSRREVVLDDRAVAIDVVDSARLQTARHKDSLLRAADSHRRALPPGHEGP